MSKTTYGRKKTKSPLKKILFTIIIILICLFLYVIIGFCASKNLESTHYTLNTNLETPIRIVHITDLHNSMFGENNNDLIQAIQESEPDVIFMTGDMINDTDPDLTIITNLVSDLSDIAPIYYGYGNHEVSWEENFGNTLRNELEKAGATIVQDNYVEVDLNGNMVRIGGCMNYYHKWGMMDPTQELWDYEEMFANNFENTADYKILLNHIPTSWIDWDGMNEYPVDLVFSGHYHGGMICIPIINKGIYAPYIGLFPDNTKGVFLGSQATCILSAGLGTEHNIPRVFNPPEIVILDLTSK